MPNSTLHAARNASGSPQPADAAAGRATASAGFVNRHVGPREDDIQAMLQTLGVGSLGELIEQTIPDDIRLEGRLSLEAPLGETQALERLRALAKQNRVVRSLIGMGYYGTETPPAIQRNILENPLWYTPYTPYQPEISQGRLEALLNFQTMVSDLTGMAVANASLLDEATAAAEAMAMCHGIARGRKPAFYVAEDCHPQTINVVRTRARSMGIELRVGAIEQADFSAGDLSGVLVQYPTTDGRVERYDEVVGAAHEAGALVVAATDLLALALLRPPGEWAHGGADIVVGNTQRFGVPLGYGGPHAAFMATTEKHVRKMPGRLVGVSKDAQGNTAFRLAIQTREQHIKRDKATSNICTAQVLLAVMAGMYAVWHGPDGLGAIAERVHSLTASLAETLKSLGHEVLTQRYFDTIAVRPADGDADATLAAALKAGLNLRRIDAKTVGISLDERTTEDELSALLGAFGGESPSFESAESPILGSEDERESPFLTHTVFHRYRSETELMRYITRLQNRDISLAHSMIPLGSCTMKLNAAAEMFPVTWPEFGDLHPYAPGDQAQGYRQMFAQLEAWLSEMTGLPAVSLQPNAGSQGEYAGLLAIKAYHESRGQTNRDICLIPTSAHGTNPASAVVAGLKVVPVQCDEQGNIDLEDLKARIQQHGAERIAAIMITYPSTHGVFETQVREVCRTVHEAGGQVYLDGANLNAQLGLTSVARIGGDVVHLNLHKTFCIPHGGGGPGMGPIAVAEHLRDFLPGDPLKDDAQTHASDREGGNVGPVAAAPYGSPSIVTISWMYVAMMGEPGLRRATEAAILNANYMAERLKEHYPTVYRGVNGRVAHEFIADCRAFQKSAGVTVDDIAKRLIDFGFHAPTMSWPVAGTLMIEPTESESRQELDRFCDAMIAIREEIRQIEQGRITVEQSPLRHAPHTAEHTTGDDWPHPYGRHEAVFPQAWVREGKYWPAVGRIDQAYGDRNLVCSCPPMEEYCEV